MHSNPSERHDIYRAVHKGLRFALSGLLTRLGSLNVAAKDDVDQLVADLRAQLGLSALHLQDEERVIHPALERDSADCLDAIRADHEDHRRSIEELRLLIGDLEAADAHERPAAVHRLYLSFSRYVADDLLHMHTEETVALSALQRAFSNAELLELEHKIVSLLTQEQFFAFMRMILPALGPDERQKMLSEMRDGMSPDAFQAMIENAAKPVLGGAWQTIESRLQIAA